VLSLEELTALRALEIVRGQDYFLGAPVEFAKHDLARCRRILVPAPLQASAQGDPARNG